MVRCETGKLAIRLTTLSLNNGHSIWRLVEDCMRTNRMTWLLWALVLVPYIPVYVSWSFGHQMTFILKFIEMHTISVCLS